MQACQNYRHFLWFGALFGLLSVAIGAFSAHALKNILSTYAIGIFETAARYQMYHSLGLVLVALLGTQQLLPSFWTKFTGVAWITGIILFSGSLYLLALTGIKWVGAITPVGGLGFILGWCGILIGTLKSQPNIERFK